MARFEAPKNSKDRMPDRLAFMVSLTLHVLLLLALACWVRFAGTENIGPFVVTATNSLDSAVLQLTPAQKIPEPQDVASTAAPETERRPQLDFKVDDVMLLPEAGESSPAVTSLASALLRSAADGLEANGQGSGATFFGTYAHGGRFVYVIDSSSSMKGLRWYLARKNLIASLSRLDAQQEYFVICFDEKTSLLFNTPPNKISYYRVKELDTDRVAKWLAARKLGESTKPSRALEYALKMQPDAIFILSDGELQDETLQMLRLYNITSGSRKKIPIHAIHLISQQGMETLKRLAQENGGTFRHVPR